MAHDFARQRAETDAVLGDLVAKHKLPDLADVDYFFVPNSEQPNWQTLDSALTKEGFLCEIYAAEGAPDSQAYLMATLPDQPITVTGIWIGEEAATRIALEHGFVPDGWGLAG